MKKYTFKVTVTEGCDEYGADEVADGIRSDLDAWDASVELIRYALI